VSAAVEKDDPYSTRIAEASAVGAPRLTDGQQLLSVRSSSMPELSGVSFSTM
jgi:hypothetical protein